MKGEKNCFSLASYDVSLLFYSYVKLVSIRVLSAVKGFKLSSYKIGKKVTNSQLSSDENQRT